MTIILSRLTLVIGLLLATAIASIPFAPAYGQNTSCVPNPNEEVGGGILLDEDGVAVVDGSGEIVACDLATGDAYQFQRSGIFGCAAAEYALPGSIGARAAIGGVYVPVNDAAVTLNTASLVYKECVLDGVSKRIAESAATSLVSKGLNDILTGRDGRPMWPEDYIADIVERSDRAVIHALESGQLAVLNPSLQNEVINAVARNYMAETRKPASSLECPSRMNIRELVTNPTQQRFTLADFSMLGQRPCNLFFVAEDTRSFVGTRIALDRQEFDFRLSTGQGLYGVESYDPTTGRYTTRTPGILVSSNVQQLVQAGFDNLNNVTEIDQMVGSLFSSLSTQAISDSRGLSGLTQSVLGQPSYLDQMTREASQGLRDAAVNTALQILSAARANETRYLAAMNAIAAQLTGTISQLREAENQCWALVVPQAQQYASQNGFQITVATTTAKSQQVIDSQIRPLADVILPNVQTSEQALELINRLIVGVTNTTSLEAQRLALQQLDSLVAQGRIHNQYDVQEAEGRRDEVAAFTEGLVEDTIIAWADSTDPNVGWCNVNNPSVPQMWAERWRN